MNIRNWVNQNTIHRIYAGSRLYGTARPDSDWDVRGVCLMPPEALLGLTNFEQYNGSKAEDIVIYGLVKFFKLALGANPNLFELLFAPPEYWKIDSPQWNLIYSQRHLFLSQRVRYTFSGYARSQLKRLQGHYRWLTNPPVAPPELEDFGGWLEKGKKGGQTKTFPHLDAERKYNRALKTWKQYQTWKRERNPVRAELERKFGYDTKHAQNLVRMMLKGMTLVETGEYNPVLDDTEKETVLSVYRGEWDYHDLVAWAERMDERIQNTDSVLPKKANHSAVEQLLIMLNLESLREEYESQTYRSNCKSRSSGRARRTCLLQKQKEGRSRSVHPCQSQRRA